MKTKSYLCLLLLASPAFSVTLASRLGTPFGITANDNCVGGSDGSALGAPVGSFDTIIFQWSDMHTLQGAITARAARDRASGLKIMLGMSPTKLTGLRTDIDLPSWVANACGLTQNTASFSNPCLQAQFIADATTYAAALQPEYFHLATEINTFILRKLVVPNDNELVFFGLLYQSAYPQVKAASPNTKVFVSFQYELETNLERSNPGSWDTFLGLFRGNGASLLDEVGYTTYPSSSPFLSGQYASPTDIPVSYYAATASHLKSSEKVVFTEVGWPSQGTSTEAAQKTFLDRLPELMAPAAPALISWALLHDVDAGTFGGNVSLASVGVRTCGGSPKSGWSVLTGSGAGPSVSDPLGAIQIFPNPLRPASGQTTMNFTDAPPGTRLRIYTLGGQLVKDLSVTSFGSAGWNGTNQAGLKAASGVYFALAESDGNKKTYKVAIQR